MSYEVDEYVYLWKFYCKMLSMEQGISKTMLPKVIPENVRDKWGSAAKEGYQAVPHALFRFQHDLELSSSELVTLLNILDFWWEAERKPWPTATTLAKRMGVDARSVQRHLKKLESLGYLQRERIPEMDLVKQYNLDGLVKKLQHLVQHGSSGKPPRRRRRKEEEILLLDVE